MNKLKDYIEDVIKEMRKVSWPKRNELVDNTVIVVIATVIISLFVYLADQVISRGLGFIY